MMAVEVSLSRRPLGLGRVLLYLVLGLLGVVWLSPFVIVVITAFRSEADFFNYGVFSIPHSFEWRNLLDAWEIGNFQVYYRNSLIVSFLKVPLGILIASLAAYPLAKMRFPLDNSIFLLFLIGLAVPIHVTLLPVFILIRHLGLSNTLWSLFPPYIAFGLPLQIFVMRGFFKMIPTELLEAARLDGATELRNFWLIMMPLAKPALATLFIIDFVSTWNELLIALVLLNSESVRTVPLGLLNFQGQYSSQITDLNAGILLSILPIIVVFLAFQRYLVAGLTGGALKE